MTPLCQNATKNGALIYLKLHILVLVSDIFAIKNILYDKISESTLDSQSRYYASRVHFIQYTNGHGNAYFLQFTYSEYAAVDKRLLMSYKTNITERFISIVV